jgi:hypothetical protein
MINRWTSSLQGSWRMTSRPTSTHSESRPAAASTPDGARAEVAACGGPRNVPVTPNELVERACVAVNQGADELVGGEHRVSGMSVVHRPLAP